MNQSTSGTKMQPEHYDRFVLISATLFFGCCNVWLQSVIIAIFFESQIDIAPMAIAWQPCLMALAAAPVICCSLVPAIRRKNPCFCSGGFFVVVGAMAVALAELLAIIYTQTPPPAHLTALSALLVGTSGALALQQWTYIWGALFTVENKRRVFQYITYSIMGSTALFFLLTTIIPYEHAVYAVLTSHALFIVSTIGCSALAKRVEPFYRELAIAPLSETPSRWNIGRGRPFTNFNTGFMICALIMFVCFTDIWEIRFEAITLCVLLGTCPLLIYAIVKKAIPHIGDIDRIANVALGISALLILTGNSTLRIAGLGLLTTLTTVCSVFLIGNVALMIPCMNRSSVDACAKILTNVLAGLLAGSLLSLICVAVELPSEHFIGITCDILVLLALIEPAMAPYKSTVVDHLYVFANGSDALDESLSNAEESNTDDAASLPANMLESHNAPTQAHSADQTVEECIDSVEKVRLSIATSYGLSPREIEVFMLLARGHTARGIAEKLFISINTVKTHTYSLYHKLGVRNKQELLNMLEKAVDSSRSDDES